MAKLTLRMRQHWIRLTHWEYWSFNVVYTPIYFYWFWLMLKARSFFFFNVANPLIRNGGFLMESKKEIYDFIPPAYYPKTILVKSKDLPDEIMIRLEETSLHFPLIAKPDIGMRGLQVALLENLTDLILYVSKTKVDFLIQEYVAYENEVGIFYCRFPHQSKGTITGIVGKEFLSVEGDGKLTIAQLLLKNNRAVLQWQKLKAHYGSALATVLPKAEKFTLVPFGNHSRGAKFIDLTHMVDEALSKTINDLCNTIPEFYYGRLDIRFRSWQDFKDGKLFSIIELNGAGSEPTHIYDPRHSIFFAWREIMRHLRLLYAISKHNKKAQNLPYMTTHEGIAMLKANRKHVALISQ